MRYKPDKTAVIIDHVGNVHRHGLPDTPREWTLEPKAKSNIKINSKNFTVKQCENCYFTHKPMPVCPACGYVYKPDKKSLKEIKEAELKEIVSNYNNSDECSTVKQLYMFAELHGYKRGWAYYEAKKKGLLF